MRYLLDARLEQTDPTIHIIDGASQKTVMSWDADKVRRALQSGDICCQEFFSASAQELASLVSHLLFLDRSYRDPAPLPAP